MVPDSDFEHWEVFSSSHHLHGERPRLELQPGALSGLCTGEEHLPLLLLLKAVLCEGVVSRDLGEVLSPPPYLFFSLFGYFQIFLHLENLPAFLDCV